MALQFCERKHFRIDASQPDYWEGDVAYYLVHEGAWSQDLEDDLIDEGLVPNGTLTNSGGTRYVYTVEPLGGAPVLAPEPVLEPATQAS